MEEVCNNKKNGTSGIRTPGRHRSRPSRDDQERPPEPIRALRTAKVGSAASDFTKSHAVSRPRPSARPRLSREPLIAAFPPACRTDYRLYRVNTRLTRPAPPGRVERGHRRRRAADDARDRSTPGNGDGGGAAGHGDATKVDDAFEAAGRDVGGGDDGFHLPRRRRARSEREHRHALDAHGHRRGRCAARGARHAGAS